MAHCIGFEMQDVTEAWNHMRLDLIKSYGDRVDGHLLHTWDDGERFLFRCRNCGGYVLVQRSEYHGSSDDDDSYYRDYFPVESPREADEMNQKYDGYSIERKFPGNYLIWTNGEISWSQAFVCLAGRV